MANRRVPKFSLNNCAQSSKKDVNVPKILYQPIIKVYQILYLLKLVEFSKAMFTILPKIICPCSNQVPIR